MSPIHGFPWIFDWFECGWKRKIFEFGFWWIQKILNIFWPKFHGLILELIEWIDAKGVDLAQPIRLSDCKKVTLVLKTLKIPFSGQPDNHISWATSMPFASIYPIDPKTKHWNFGKKIFRIVGFEKMTFFESTKSKNFHFASWKRNHSKYLLKKS